jgi:two-component system nitrogen regulation response regulator GlnG
MPTLLVVDDEPNVLYSLEKSLRSDALDVVTAGTGRQGIELAEARAPDAVILDVRLPDMSGLDAFDAIRRHDPRLPVILITAYAATETAIEAMKRGAFEYLLKPVDFRQLREVVARAIEAGRHGRAPAALDGEEAAGDADRIVGDCPAMQAVYKAIGRVAPLDVPVLVLGESGTGKELVARALCRHSRRSQAPFLAINCAAIPDQLLESELFGHEKGAFTGADRRRVGRFEQAHGGTIFLDEIGDMPAPAQPKLLRLLQEQQFTRLGGNDTVRTDVRVIAATNQNLEELVAAGRFRQDLFYRLKVVTIALPPLRERPGDLPLLVEHFVRRLGPALGRPVGSVAPEALPLLERHDWPGNVRELHSVLKYALVHAAGEVLTADCLPEELRRPPRGTGFQPGRGADRVGTLSPEAGLDVVHLVGRLLETGELDIYRRVASEVDRVVLGAVLRHVRGNQLKASELLGISRTTLRAKLRGLGLAVEKQLLAGAGQELLPASGQPD